MESTDVQLYQDLLNDEDRMAPVLTTFVKFLPEDCEYGEQDIQEILEINLSDADITLLDENIVAAMEALGDKKVLRKLPNRGKEMRMFLLYFKTAYESSCFNYGGNPNEGDNQGGFFGMLFGQWNAKPDNKLKKKVSRRRRKKKKK